MSSLPDAPTWTPSVALLDDARQVLAASPQETAEDRFESEAWQALLDRAGPVLLTRSAAPSHITASACVLSTDARATCLVLHARIGRWVQPGGHLDPGDHRLADAAARETAEETGLSGRILGGPVMLSRHRAPCRPGVVDWHLDVQYLVEAERALPAVSAESIDVAWWDVAELPGLAEDGRLADGVLPLVHRALARHAG